MYQNKELFNLLIKLVKETAETRAMRLPHAFGYWFIQMYFSSPQNLVNSDGSRDGKVDWILSSGDSDPAQHFALNTKFTQEYNKIAPVAFYNEILAFYQMFKETSNRDESLERMVKPELRAHYRKLFKKYDDELTKLVFVTNFRRNDAQFQQVKKLPVKVFHLEDVIQHMADDIEGAMPRTPELVLSGINSLLSPDERDTEVPTSIVFARLIDFIDYMRDDPFELLFARNVRLSLGNTAVNKDIRSTFQKKPREFVFSNNGITLICDRHTHDPGEKELRIENPRVVNGSQTLHSIRDVPNPSSNARVMVRIIESRITGDRSIEETAAKRKDIIYKIAIRSNLQNPIKKWNLLSNDAYQQELARYFKKNDYFYERRAGEWNYRSRTLRTKSLSRGPEIRKLTQLIACYHWKNDKLGPANAKQRLADLFELRAYDVIRSTQPAVVYQLYLLNERISESYRRLARKTRYFKQFSGHASLALFTIAVKCLDSVGAKWGKPEVANLLDFTDDSKRNRKWDELVKLAMDMIQKSFKSDAINFRKREHFSLSYNNYFKSQSYVGRLLDHRVPLKMKQAAKTLLK